MTTATALSTDLVRGLLESRLIAKLATFDDGFIHLVPVWFSWDGQALYIPTRGDQRKVRNVEQHPTVTVTIDDSRAGFDVCGVMLVGQGDCLRGPKALIINRRVHLKYVSEDDLQLEPVSKSLSTDDTTIRVVPNSVRSWDYRNVERARLAAHGVPAES